MIHRRLPFTLFTLLLLLPLMLMTSTLSCQSNDDDDDSEDDDDDDTVGDDDNDSGDDDDDDDTPVFRTVRPDLPMNAYHIAGSHNTYIWSGPQGGPSSLVASLGPLQALDRSQRILEIDATEPTGDGDFFVDHGGSTHRVRLSGILNNIRWWSDTHPGHEMIVLGFQWDAGTGAAEMESMRTLVARYLAGPSVLTQTGPLLELSDWVEELTRELDEDARDAVAALNPSELVRVLGFPSIRTLRGKIVLEVGSGKFFREQRVFFKTGSDGQFDNNSEGVLDDLDKLTEIRSQQRMARVYPAGNRIDSSNFDLYESLEKGVAHSAMNHQYSSPETKEVSAFLDENAPGFAPAGFVRSEGDFPSRLGPPVFVTAFGEKDGKQIFTAQFDPELGIGNPPLVLLRILTQGICGGSVESIQLQNEDAVVLSTGSEDGLSVIVALPPGQSSVSFSVTANGDRCGYEMHVSGPTLSGLDVEQSEGQSDSETSLFLWTSPTFAPVNLVHTGRCSVLETGGVRLTGTLEDGRCNTSQNPSFLVELEMSDK